MRAGPAYRTRMTDVLPSSLASLATEPLVMMDGFRANSPPTLPPSTFRRKPSQSSISYRPVTVRRDGCAHFRISWHRYRVTLNRGVL